MPKALIGNFHFSCLKKAYFLLSLLIINFKFTAVLSLPDDRSQPVWILQPKSTSQTVFTDDSSKRIFVVSLFDGTLTAIDSDSGTILWSFNDDNRSLIDPLLTQSYGVTDEVYLPSTTGELYRIYDGIAELITHDDSDRTHFNRDYMITSSRQDIITLGINILTGKLYYYCSSSTCYKNISNEITDDEYSSLLIVKRTVKIIQLLDLKSGNEIVRFINSNNQLFAYHESEALFLADDGKTTLHYEIESNIIYGVNSHTQTFPGVTCWKTDLRSPIVASWAVYKNNEFFVIKTQKLIDLLSKGFETRFVGDDMSIEESDSNLKCKFPLFLNIHEKYAVVNTILQHSSHNCKKTKLLALSRHINSHVEQISPVQLTNQEVLEAIKRLRVFNYDIHRTTHSSEEGKKLRVKVSWRKISFKKVGKVNLSLIDNSDTKAEIVLSISFCSLWKEFLFGSVLILCFIIYFTRSYKRKLLQQQENIKVSLEKSMEQALQQSTSSFPVSLTSRYETEFIHIESIGSGGFGVVSKAENKIDGCVYAIKRVSIPDCVLAKEKVMREVKALAQLNHPGIIRFYQAWVEFSLEPCKLPDKNDLVEATLTCDSQSSLKAQNIDSSASHNLFTEAQNIDSSSSHIYFSTMQKNGFSTEHDFFTKTHDSKIQEDIDDDYIVFDRGDDPSPSPLWEGVETSSSPESFERSEHSNLQDLTNYTLIKSCKGKENCSHHQKISVFIQMELCHKRTLKYWLFHNLNRDLNFVISIFVQILQALHYVHSKNLMHRDLKPSNIFFSFTDTVKLGDFGLVTRFTIPQSEENNNTILIQEDFQMSLTKLVGTELYMSPELLEEKPYNFKVDIFALGLILIELLVPFKTETERRSVLFNARTFTFPTDCITLTDEYIELIKWMLHEYPDNRPSTGQLLDHPHICSAQSLLLKEYSIRLPPSKY